jgi:GAF domain-containing protein
VATPVPPPLGEAGATGRVIIAGRPWRVNDVAAAPEGFSAEGRADLLARGARSVLIVPMSGHDRVIGTINLSHRDVGAFTDAHVELLETFADQAVIAIENVRLFTELQQKNQALTEAHAQVSETLEQQTATAEVLRVMSRSPTDVGPVFDVILANATRLCAAQLAVLWLYEGGDLFRAVAFYGASPQYRSWLSGGAHRVPPVLFRARGPWRPAHVEDATAIPHLDSHPLIRASVELEGMRTLLGVPLVKQDELVGAVTIYRKEVSRFSDQHIALVETFADQAVIAIDNVRLFTELQEKNGALTRAHAQVTEALEQQTATSGILGAIQLADRRATGVRRDR